MLNDLTPGETYGGGGWRGIVADGEHVVDYVMTLYLGGEVDGNADFAAALAEGVVFGETLSDSEGLFAEFLTDAVKDGAVDEEATCADYANFENVEITGPVEERSYPALGGPDTCDRIVRGFLVLVDGRDDFGVVARGQAQ